MKIIKTRQLIVTTTCIISAISTSIIKSPLSAYAQNVFPLTIGGEEKIYMDSNDIEGIDEGDKYFTLNRVTLEDAGDDTGKTAIIVNLQGKDYQSIYVLDGLDGDGGLTIHEPEIDVAYRDDNGDTVTVQNKWAHVGESGAPSTYEGFIHSATFGMSNSSEPYHGYNTMSWQVEHGDTPGEDIVQSGIAVEYNNDDYANTMSYDTGGLLGTVVMDIDGSKDTLSQDNSLLGDVFGNYGSKTHSVHVPVDGDGNVLLTDNEDDGFFLKFALKPVRTDNGQPIRLPEKPNGATGALPAINMMLLDKITEPSENQ